ncbi:MAG: hypothetical protein ACJAZO_001671 [Myxococcota bacterium]|jgi:hypothetical protein
MSWSSDPEPKHPREYFTQRAAVPDRFAAMDLPYFGGKIESSGPNGMQVSYGDEATVDQLVEWWPVAMEASGWIPTSTQRYPDGTLSARYATPNGEPSLLMISPTGTLWTVDLTVTTTPQ